MKKIPLLITALLVGFSASPAWSGEAAVENPPASTPGLDPPPLPTLPSGEWKAEKILFNDALEIEDASLNPLDKAVDLPGTRYSAHLDYTRRADALDEDRINLIASVYDQALAEKAYEYRLKLPGLPYNVVSASSDGPEGGVYGQAVAAAGKLRFIAVTTIVPDIDNQDIEAPKAKLKDIQVAGDIEIFVSDEIPLTDLAQKIDAAPKGDTMDPKR